MNEKKVLAICILYLQKCEQDRVDVGGVQTTARGESRQHVRDNAGTHPAIDEQQLHTSMREQLGKDRFH